MTPVSLNNIDNVESNFEQDIKMEQLRKELAKKFDEYRLTVSFMAADAPLEVLCLPPVIENALLTHGCLRIYDLFNCNFVEVKGLGARRIRYLTTRLNEFLSML